MRSFAISYASKASALAAALALISGAMVRSFFRPLAGRLFLLNLVLTGCAHPSYERASDGSTVYLDELSDAVKAQLRQKIVQSLSRGVPVYDLGIGDEVET